MLDKKELNNQGMTLIEIIISISIFVLVMTMGASYITTGFKSSRFSSEQDEAVQNARKALKSLSKDVREAMGSEKGDYALNTIEAQNFVWYGDIDNDGKTEKIRYFVESSLLKRVTSKPGILNDYSDNEATTTIARYINNQSEPIFSYFDSNNLETSVINQVRLININLKLNVTPTIAPNDYYVETDIQLRNLKDNL